MAPEAKLVNCTPPDVRLERRARLRGGFRWALPATLRGAASKVTNRLKVRLKF
jgi:hypothetical protein